VTDLPPLTWLYVPADRPDRVEKALASAAHAVIVDLEDAVAPAAKNDARANLGALFAVQREKRVHVRVNALSTEWGRADLDAVAALHVDGVSIPKVESPGDADVVAGVLGGRSRVHGWMEPAAGVGPRTRSRATRVSAASRSARRTCAARPARPAPASTGREAGS